MADVRLESSLDSEQSIRMEKCPRSDAGASNRSVTKARREAPVKPSKPATCCDDRAHQLQRGLLADLQNCLFTDIEFLLGSDGSEKSVKAHRSVLGTVNPVFQSLLLESQFPTIRIPNVHPEGFWNLIRFCYGDKGFLPNDLLTLCGTYLAALKFQVSELKPITENKISSIMPEQKTVHVLTVATELNMSKLKKNCLETISSQFKEFLLTEDLFSAPLEVVESILYLWSDYGFEYQLWAVFTFLEWVERHNCSDDIKRRVFSNLKAGSIKPEMADIYFRRTMHLIPNHQHQIFSKFLYSEKFHFPDSEPDSEHTITFCEGTPISSFFEFPKEASNLKIEEERSRRHPSV